MRSSSQASTSHAGCRFGRHTSVIAVIIALAILIVLLSKIANEVPPEPPPGTSFSLKAQKVVGCSSTEITLVDTHQKQTNLEKDDSWPACKNFKPDAVQDFYLSRGEKTHFQSAEPSSWWRKAL